MEPQMNPDERGIVTVEAMTLEVEELEEVIAPGISVNHNETLVGDSEDAELEVEELEEVIAPGLTRNHNEAFIFDPTN